jgi:2-dehydro-3-deoxyphosphogluconate aldolase/(4S)-4-hydroxy-2-oxoglutarate aldolase
MTIDDVIQQIRKVGIVPVVRAATPGDATRAVEAICEGGIPVVEITMTVPGATTVIAQVVRHFGSSVLVGAGTVTTAEQARLCVDAGAEFIVSPGLSLAVLSVAQASGKLAIDADRTDECSLQRRQAGQDFSVRECRRSQVSPVIERPIPECGLDPDRRRESFERRRIHCRRSFCSWSWSGPGE